jgi:hypothetical protein
MFESIISGFFTIYKLKRNEKFSKNNYDLEDVLRTNQKDFSGKTNIDQKEQNDKISDQCMW